MNTISKAIFVIMAVMIAGMTMGCLESGDEVTEDGEYVYVEQTPIIPVATPTQTSVVETDMVSMIPDNYYMVSDEHMRTDEGFIRYLDKFSWKRSMARSGGWSFREAAELEHDLTEMGYNVTIRMAECKTTIDHSEFETRIKTDGYERWAGLPELDQVSCWIMIEMDGEMVAYDPTYCYWIFKPDHVNKDDYGYRGIYHSWWYYVGNTTYNWPHGSVMSYNFIDFDDIYELEEYYMSGDMRSRDMGSNKKGVWWSYVDSGDYNKTDDFLITFGWWLSEDELDDIETRINRATDWYVCGE